MRTSNATATANALLEHLRAFKPNQLYALAPLKTVQIALDDFEAESVRRFRWVEDGEILLADVSRRPGSRHLEEVCLAIESSRLLATCTCRTRTGCRHATTALMVISRLLRDARFTNWEMDPALHGSLLEQLESAPIDDFGNGAPRETAAVRDLIVVAPGPLGEMQMHRRTGEAAKQLGRRRLKREPLPEDLVRILTSPEDGTILESAVREWWPLASAGGECRLGIMMESGIVPVEKTDVRPVEGYIAVERQDGHVFLASGVRFVGGTRVEEVCRIGEHLVFLPATAELAWLVDEACWGRMEVLTHRMKRPKSAVFPVLPRVRFELERFNRIGFPAKTAAGLRLVPPDRDELRLPSEKSRREIEIDFSDEGKVMLLRPRVVVGGAELPGVAEVLQFMENARELAPRKFFSDADRHRAARRAAFSKLLDGDAAENALEDPEQQRHLDRYANAVVEYLTTGTEAVLQVSERADDLEHPWKLVSGVLRSAARVVAVLASVMEDHGDWSIGRDGVCLRGDADVLFEHLAGLLEVCHAHQVALKHQSQLVNPGELKLEVRAESAEADEDQIDWLEVHPDVRCGDFEIPPDQWETIIRGRFVQLPGDGGVRLLHLRSVDALERLKAVWDATDDRENGADSAKIPRMRILDWLAIAKQGVRLELPADERAVVDALLNFEKMKKARLPSSMDADLRPYQKQGYRWLAFLYEHRFGACLADDMGLGKTIQAITLLAGLAEGKVKRPGNGCHLIVLPPTLVFNWRSEIERFCPTLDVAEYMGSKRSAKVFEKSQVVLTTYEIVRRDIETLKDVAFDVVIFDEAQAVKNFTGARSKAARQLDARFRLCLTGTPLENHVGEYYSIVELALPGLLGDRKRFVRDARADSESAQLRRARPFVLRRTKEKILKELPPKVESDIYFDLTKRQKEIYTRTVAEVREHVAAMFAEKPEQKAGIAALAALTRLRQICLSPAILDADYTEESPKIVHLCTQLEEIIDEGSAALVFSQFTRALDLLEAGFVRRGIAFQRMDGKTPAESRKELVRDFQSGEGPGVFLVSLKTGGAGLNLTRAGYVFHFDPWWNPAVENQASDRAHRIGQRQTVFVNRLLMRHTIEEKMMELKKRKQALYDQIVGGAEEHAASRADAVVRREDLEFLLGS